MAHNVLGIRRFFVPDEEKCEAFLRAQKNVAEQNPTKGVPAPSARPTGVLCSPNCPNRAICVYRLLCAVCLFYIFIILYIKLLFKFLHALLYFPVILKWLFPFFSPVGLYILPEISLFPLKYEYMPLQSLPVQKL